MSSIENTEETSNNSIFQYIKLDVSEDGMEATIRLKGKKSLSVTSDNIMEILNSRNIIYGTDKPAIQHAVDQYHNESPDEPISFVAARGKPTTPGQNGRLEFFVDLDSHIHIDDSGRADYRNIEKFKTVNEGQKLAKYYPSTSGKDGLDVFGNTVRAPAVENPKLIGGDNVSINPVDHVYISTANGVLSYEKDTISVHTVLNIHGNVGIESGNVDYEGDIHVGGNIDRGSSVRCRGNLNVHGMIESGRVKCMGNLHVDGGINTHKDDTIYIFGNTFASFVDNSSLTTYGSIQIVKSLIASNIICHGNITITGKGGTLSGGEIHSFSDVEADNIGNKTETPTKIILGEHHRNMVYAEQYTKELKSLEDTMKTLEKYIKKIKVYVARSRGHITEEKKSHFRITFQKYKALLDRIKNTEEHLQHYKSLRYNEEPVHVIVRDTIYPGVKFQYKSIVEKIRSPRSSCILIFRPGSDKVEMKAYKT